MNSFFFRCVLIVVGCISVCEARTWTSKAGTNIDAELVKRQGDQVALRTDKGRTLKVKVSDLSRGDQQYLEELLIQEAGTKIEGVSAEPGKISGAIKCEDSQWTYHVYLPKNFHMARKWPVWFIMSYGGGHGGGMMKRYIKGAEAAGCILVGSVESKNKFEQSQEAMEAMADDVYKRLPVESGFAFASGCSGGGRQSYLLAETNRNIAGILPCAAGGGVYPDGASFRQSKLRKKTYVYSLMGTNCFNRTGSYKTHTSLSDDCRLRFFPGNHDWANEDLIEQGMVHVVGKAILGNDDLDPYRELYLPALKELTERLKAATPWESYYLAALGKELDARYEKGYFSKTAAELGKDSKVNLALEAEKDMLKLCSEFYLKYTYHSGDREDKPKRTAMGEKLASPYSEIPHGEMLKRLGVKCK